MSERVVFLTGKLAEAGLRRLLESLAPLSFDYEVRNIGISVAGLMTTRMILRRVGRDSLQGVSRVIVPGLCGGDLAEVEAELGIPVQRGPEDLRELPEFLKRKRPPPRLDRYELLIFAEIVDAPKLEVEAIVQRAERFRRDGADVIDLGFLPGAPFPHLEESIQALHQAGCRVSVDTLETEELLRGGRAGADYLLSLREDTLWVADEVPATPVLLPAQPNDLDSLCRAVERMQGRACLADSVLDPIHFGFTASLARYHELRRRLPEVDIMVGVGNLTELTEADTAGINAILLGVCSELQAGAILTTEVSPHARSAIYEADQARRILYAAHAEAALPKNLSPMLTGIHERRPLLMSAEEIRELAQQLRDPGYRVLLSEEGIHVCNRDGLVQGRDPFDLFPKLADLQQDAPHAFYMGVELARAQIAWQLGKRYRQDRELDWGAALPPSRRALTGSTQPAPGTGMDQPEGSTLKASREQRRRAAQSRRRAK